MRSIFCCILLLWGAEAAAQASCTSVNYRCEAANSSVVADAGHATVMLRIPEHGQCTGTLLNNARGDGRPYILTARHCVSKAQDAQLPALAQAMEISYGYETACGSSETTVIARTTGAIHRASHGDAWLVEALTAPPADAEAYLAGIYLAGDTRRAFGVHHGNGGAKQFVEQQVTASSVIRLLLGLVSQTLQTWATDLLRGSTPNGSSGSALFDEQARVLGTLSGGVNCAGSGTGNNYQQISEVWNGGGTAASGLRAWLDPDRVGVQSIAGSPAKGLSTETPHPPAVVEGSVDGGGGGGSIPPVVVLALVLGVALRRLRQV